MLKLLVFDLDGTLADTRTDLAVSVNAALARVGRTPLPLETVIAFLGDGARNLVTRSLMAAGDGSASGSEIEATLEAFLEHYRGQCLEATMEYPGTSAALASLAGYRKAVLTNKPGIPARRIIDGLGLAPHFAHLVGGDNPLGLKPDPSALRALMEAEKVSPEETVMIGDGVQDLFTARRAGTLFLGFLNGMADRGAMLAGKPKATYASMAELPAAIAALARGDHA